MLCANSAGLDGANYGGHCDPDDRGTNRGQHSGDHRAAAPHHIKIERPLHSQPSRARGPLRRSNILLSNLEVYFENMVTSPVIVDAARDFLSETPKRPTDPYKENRAALREAQKMLRFGNRALPGILPRHAAARLARSTVGGQRWRARHYPGARGVLPARAATALPGAQDAQFGEQTAGRPLARVQGPRRGLLLGGLAGLGAAAAR